MIHEIWSRFELAIASWKWGFWGNFGYFLQSWLIFMNLRWQLWAQILTKFHESKMDSTLLFNPFPVVYMNFARKNLLACLCSAEFTVETISMIFPYLVNFYPQIRDPINLIYMSTTYLVQIWVRMSYSNVSGYLFWPRVPNASGNFHCSSLPVSQVQVIPTVKKNITWTRMNNMM